MRSEQETNEAVERYADLVRRLCMIHLKNHADTEDIFQTVFLKYLTSTTVFESREHEKAWVIRVTLNACRDLLRSFFRSRTVSLDTLLDQPVDLAPAHSEVLETVLSLPAQYRMSRICTIMRDIPHRRSGKSWERTKTLSIRA